MPMFTYLLTTKFHIPPPRPSLVSRPRLIERLNAGLHGKLTLVCAPAGFGKTTLVSTWLQDVCEPVAWLSLDEDDNDPVRFVTYLVAGLQQVEPSIGRGVQVMLQSSPTSAPEALIGSLINDLAAMSEPFMLVLDDYHLIKTPVIQQALAFLLRHQPPPMHLVMISRSEPPLQMARLRARGQLLEISPADLRFTSEEATRFLNQVMGLSLTPDEVAALSERTEGWIAGLQLAALSMRSHEDVERFVQSFSGSHRYVLDYLLEEVLGNQSEPVQTFLRQTCILDRLTAPLCDAVTGQTDSQAMLLRLERANLFLIALDDERRWYRYHHLFADFLRAQLRKRDREAYLLLHRRASAWYAQAGEPTEGIKHALSAEEFDLATRLIEPLAITLLTRGELVTLLKWLDSLPESLVRTRPRLILARACIMLAAYQWQQVESLLQAAEKALSENATEYNEAQVQRMWNEVVTLQAIVANKPRGDRGRAIELSKAALARLPEDDLLLRGMVLMSLGMAYESTGKLADASQAYREAVALHQAAHNFITALRGIDSLATLEVEQGRLHHAAGWYRQALQLIAKWKERFALPPIGGRCYSNMADLFREFNQLERAQHYLAIAFEITPQGQRLGRLSLAYLVQARLLQAQSDASGALKAILEAQRRLPSDSSLSTWVSAVQALIWLKQGELAAAMGWATSCGLPLDAGFDYLIFPGEYAILARVLIHQRRLTEALALLERMYSVAHATKRSGRLLEILILQAIALYHQGKPEDALTRLTRALAIAEPAGYIRIFVDEGASMASLLQLGQARAIAEPYVKQLLSAFPQPKSDKPAIGKPATVPPTDLLIELIDPLSERELEVLRLVATGMKNQQIADHLVIAVSTVKSHTNKIYHKLNVRNRTQAVARARELKLL
ncbi:MAG: HTH-type transcriptional regulator MalT [Ardenticatenaceae bacterium]